MTDTVTTRNWFSLNGKTALVTGAGRGLGADIASALAQAGATVYAVSRSLSELEAVVNGIHANGGSAHAVTCDVTQPDEVARVLADIPRLDILVNNAGTNIPATFTEVTPEQLDTMLTLNVRSVFLTSQQVTQKMLADGNTSGAIINMSSQMGHVGAERRSVYCTTKHAIEGLTKAMAIELAPHNIRVNSVAPTFVETPMTKAFLADEAFRSWVMNRLPMGRLLPSRDVALAVCYLASDAATLITGTSLKLDGGWTAQ